LPENAKKVAPGLVVVENRKKDESTKLSELYDSPVERSLWQEGMELAEVAESDDLTLTPPGEEDQLVQIGEMEVKKEN